MNFVIEQFTATPHALPQREVARYMGVRGDGVNYEIASRIEQLWPYFQKEITCKACWLEAPVSISENVVDLGYVTVRSDALAVNLMSCEKAILFAATIGGGADRLCRAAAVSSPSKALIFDAMGSAAIEWFCDTLCEELSHKYPQYGQQPRFSPGYGDLPLTLQTDFLHILDACRKIGLTLSDSLLMIPQKSVTAIVGLKTNQKNKEVEL